MTARYVVNGRPEDVERFLLDHEASNEEVRAVRALAPGESALVGGHTVARINDDDSDLPPGWRRVNLSEVLHPKMIEDLVRHHNARDLSSRVLSDLIDKPEYAAFMESHGLMPRFAFYWLQANLGIWN